MVTWIRRCVVAAIAACASAGVLAARADAAPSWLAPQNVFSTPVNSIPKDTFFNRQAIDVATDAAGNSIAVWIEQHPKVPGPGVECQAMEAERPAGGSFGAPHGLGPAMTGCADQIKLAMNASGAAIVAWTQDSAIDASIRQPGGSFSPPTTLAGPGAVDDPWVAINNAGVAAVSWDDTSVGSCSGPWAFHAVVRQPSVGFGGVETVCEPHAGSTIFTPRVVVDQQGDVVATWVNDFFDGSFTHFDIESANRPAGGSFTGQTPQVLGDMVFPSVRPPAFPPSPAPFPPPAGSFAADIAIDAQGRATAVWPFFNGSVIVIDAAVRPPGATSVFSAGAPISDAGVLSNSPRVAVEAGTNTAVAVWVQGPGCSAGNLLATNCQVEGSARPSGGGFQTPQALSAPGASTDFGPLVAFDPSGGAIAIWSGPSPDIAGTQVQVTRRPPGLNQTFGAVTTISTDAPSESPALAFDNEGNAIAIWEHETTSPAGVIQYAGFDGAPPDILSVSAPAGVAGKPVSFSANVTDRWTTPTVTWNFGDGVTATGSSVTHTYAKHGIYPVIITAQDGVGNQRSSSTSVAIGCAPPPKGVKLDANCHRIKPKPTPRVNLTVNFRAVDKGHGSAEFTSITVVVTKNANVQVRCLGKHTGCPFKTKPLKTKHGKANAAKLLHGRTLRAGTVVQIRATKKGAIGAVANLTVQKGTGSVSFLCLPLGKSKPRARCPQR